MSEYTIASTTQMINPVNKSWAKSLLNKLGIPDNILTDIINAGTVVGQIGKWIYDEINVKNVPVIAVAEHDTASAVAAVPALGGEYAYLSSGTWSLMGIESPIPLINDITFELDYTNEGGINNTSTILKNIMGLWIYQECKRTWDKTGEVLSFDQLEQLAVEAKPFTALINPDDDLFYSPGNMPQKIQEFCRRTSQTVPESKGEIVRCIMESLALKYRMTLEGLEKIAGYSIPVIHIVGGGCRNEMLCQFTADAAGRPVIAGPVEATAVGNIICQMIALGHVANLKEARTIVKNSFPTIEYMPKNIEIWDEAYYKFKLLTN